jgi:uncharacterized protein (DUF4213/DUF364 family)
VIQGTLTINTKADADWGTRYSSLGVARTNSVIQMSCDRPNWEQKDIIIQKDGHDCKLEMLTYIIINDLYHSNVNRISKINDAS